MRLRISLVVWSLFPVLAHRPTLDDVLRTDDEAAHTGDHVEARRADRLHSVRLQSHSGLVFAVAPNNTNASNDVVDFPLPPVRRKVMLVLIELLGLGWFGLDRCYMGQHVLGLVKALTGGGLAVWALLDYIVVVFNCFSQAKSIDVVGYRATFQSGDVPDDVHVAFWISIFFFCFMCFCGSGGAAKRTSRKRSHPVGVSATRSSELSGPSSSQAVAETSVDVCDGEDIGEVQQVQSFVSGEIGTEEDPDHSRSIEHQECAEFAPEVPRVQWPEA